MKNTKSTINIKNTVTKITTIIIALAVLLTAVNPASVNAASKKKPTLNKKAVTVTMTNKKANPSVTLKVKNAKKAAKWTTSNKKAVSIQKTGKNSVKITAKKAGKAVITCKVDGKKLTCKITVADKRVKTDTGSGNDDTKDTENSETTEDTETEDTETEDTETGVRPACRICTTRLKTGGICGFAIYESTPEQYKIFGDHMMEHVKNGEFAQYE